MEQRRKTLYDLPEIVERCLDECKEAGYIRTGKENIAALSTQRTIDGPTVEIIVNKMEIAKHIALSVVGELLEFELVRRMAPMFREEHRIEKDLLYIEDREQEYKAGLGLRVEATPLPEAPKMQKED